MMNRQIGAQYFTIREFIKTIEDFDESCKRIREMGYKIVQISACPLEAAEMKPILDKYGLKVVVTHKAFEDFLNNIDYIIEYNKTLGCEICGLGSMPLECRNDAEGVEQFVKDVNMVAAKLKEAGLYFGYHNHEFEFVKYDGKSIMDRIIEGTDPEAVVFIVDTYWIQYAGKNPAAHIKRLGKRAMAIHFKDYKVDLLRNISMAEVGEGNLEWDEIIAACDEAGAKWALVEQDICQTDPFDCLKTSYDYLQTKGFN